MTSMSAFKTLIVVMAFFSFAVTIIAHFIPETNINYIDEVFASSVNDFNIENMRSEFEGSIGNQLGIPIIEVGALIFYSGNILIDLLLNFLFAIPIMLGLVVSGLGLLFPGINVTIIASIEGFAVGITIILYIIGLINLLTNVRSGKSIV